MAAIETRADTPLGIQIGFSIGNYNFNPSFLAIHLRSSLHSPFLKCTVHIKDTEGILGYADSLVRGASAILSFSGGPSYVSLYSLALTVENIIIENSAAPRTAMGDIIIELVPRWVYHSENLFTKVYKNITNPDKVIKEELTDLGLGDLLGAFTSFSPFPQPRNFYRKKTSSSIEFLMTQVLPWTKSSNDSPVFFFQTLGGGYISILTPFDMFQQPKKGILCPNFILYPFNKKDDTPLFSFHSRSFYNNPLKGDIFTVKSISIDENNNLTSQIEKSKIDTGDYALEFKRGYPVEEIIYFPGWRSEEEKKGFSQFLRRHLIQRQTHVLLFEDLQVATVCDVGSLVELYDLSVSFTSPSSEEDFFSEEIDKNAFCGNYIVTAAHMYWDGFNESGFTGTKLEISKMGYSQDSLNAVDNFKSFIPVEG
jgi:hypothetical protein